MCFIFHCYFFGKYLRIKIEQKTIFVSFETSFWRYLNVMVSQNWSKEYGFLMKYYWFKKHSVSIREHRCPDYNGVKKYNETFDQKHDYFHTTFQKSTIMICRQFVHHFIFCNENVDTKRYWFFYNCFTNLFQ